MAMILASQSPRRRELLGQMGFSFTVRPARGEELPHPELTPAQLVEELARQKPRDRAHAAEMLSALSGREHTVYTGVAVKRGEKLLVEHEATLVRFRPLTQREIHLYIQTGEPMDKAGGYGIQGCGALLVEGIRGDYFNVVGLPICRLGRMLAQVGEDALTRCAETCVEKER